MDEALVDRLRALLHDQARAQTVVTYRDLAERLGLVPPQTIHRVTVALERLMAEDAAAGRPLLAALAVSRGPGALPGRGFFDTAAVLGLFEGSADGAEARAFHQHELARVMAGAAVAAHEGA